MMLVLTIIPLVKAQSTSRNCYRGFADTDYSAEEKFVNSGALKSTLFTDINLIL